MNTIRYRQLGLDEAERIKEIDASQFIGGAWRDVDGRKQIVDINYQETGFPNGYKNHLASLRKTIVDAGSALGAFDGDMLIGFCTVNPEIFGAKYKYALLDQLFISRPYRSKGIGKQLVMRSVEAAKQFGAEKFYICAASSVETLAFL